MKTQDELDWAIRKAKGSAAVEELISETAAYQRYALSDGRQLFVNKNSGWTVVSGWPKP